MYKVQKGKLIPANTITKYWHPAIVYAVKKMKIAGDKTLQNCSVNKSVKMVLFAKESDTAVIDFFVVRYGFHVPTQSTRDTICNLKTAAVPFFKNPYSFIEGGAHTKGFLDGRGKRTIC